MNRILRRDRALRRLSRLTLASAVAGTIATLGFGGLAALTYAGTSSADGTTAGAGQNGQPGDAPNPQPPTAVRVAPGQAPTLPRVPSTSVVPSRTRGHGHASSGGSR